jgi:tRNA A-37 threonylcarbamoyl transferase component Bud32
MLAFIASSNAMITNSQFTQLAVYHDQYDSPLLQSILASPDDYLVDVGHERLYKHDRTTTVVLVTEGNQKFVIKRYNTKNLWHILRRSVRSTRAAICWRLAHRFMDIGITTPPPVAMIEKRFGPLRGRSYYVAEHVNGTLCIDYLRNNPDTDDIIGGIKRIFSIMLAHRVSHGDMKAANLLVSNKQVVLLDLDAAKEHKTVSRAAHAYRRDRSRFLRNWDARSNLYQRLDKEIPSLGG